MRNLLHSNVWDIVDCLNEQHFSITWVVHAWTNDNSQAIALSVSDSYTISLPCIPWMLLNCNRKIVEILPDNKLDLKTVLLFYSYFECDEIFEEYIYIFNMVRESVIDQLEVVAHFSQSRPLSVSNIERGIKKMTGYNRDHYSVCGNNRKIVSFYFFDYSRWTSKCDACISSRIESKSIIKCLFWNLLIVSFLHESIGLILVSDNSQLASSNTNILTNNQRSCVHVFSWVRERCPVRNCLQRPQEKLFGHIRTHTWFVSQCNWLWLMVPYHAYACRWEISLNLMFWCATWQCAHTLPPREITLRLCGSANYSNETNQ